jgi:hypothetical protein
VPDAAEQVEINLGNPEVTASFGTVAEISIGPSGTLSFTGAGPNSVTGEILNEGDLSVDQMGAGGSSLTIGAGLLNGGVVAIGDEGISSASVILLDSPGGHGGSSFTFGRAPLHVQCDVSKAKGIVLAMGGWPEWIIRFPHVISLANRLARRRPIISGLHPLPARCENSTSRR